MGRDVCEVRVVPGECREREGGREGAGGEYDPVAVLGCADDRVDASGGVRRGWKVLTQGAEDRESGGEGFNARR